MNFEETINQIKGLEKQIEDSKADTRFEKNKLYDYLGSSLVRSFKNYNVFIAGGLITSLFTGKEINDVDVYFRNKEDLAAFIEDFWGDYIVAHTKKATLFVSKSNNREIKVQAIHFKYFQTPQEIFDTFDFTHVMGAFDFTTEEFTLHRDFLKHNSQRILKFNKLTAFPLISLMRVKKYEDRNYSISKPELMRIVMTCMDLEIDSYDELKDQLGGMYGNNFDKLFEDVKDEEFDLGTAIDKLQDLSVNEDYFKEPTPVKFNDKDELISSICGIKPRHFEGRNNRTYKVSYDGAEFERTFTVSENSEKVDGNQFLGDRKFYKFVRKVDGRYFSYYDKNFEYKINEESEAENGLYFQKLENIKRASFSNKEDNALLEVFVDAKELMEHGHEWKFGKVKVLREVLKEEYEHLLK